MEGLNKISDQWVPLQISVFSRWVQLQLNGKSNLKVEDITKDLSSGVALCELATILTKKEPRRNWVHDPTRTVDMVQNCELAIRMFENDGVHFVGISGKDINDNKEKLILGLVWSLILHYSVVKSVENERENGMLNNSQQISDEKDGSKALMNWAADRTANYPHVDNNNFMPYGLSMCALLDTYVPEKIHYENLDPKDSENNSKLATNVMKDLGIPVLVYPEEIEKNNNKVDNKVLLTQLSSAKFVLDQSFHGIKKSGFFSDAAQMSSEVNQSEAGDRIALDTIKSVELKAKNSGKYSGSNLIDLNSIPMNLNNQNSNENSNLIDLNSIPVMQPGKTNNEHDSILTFGQKEQVCVTNKADGSAVESSSEVETTSSEVDTYDESEEGENGKPVTFVNGFVDEQGHPIPSRVNENGLVIGPNGKPIAGIVGYDAQGNPIYAKVNENGVVIGKDGKPVAGIVGYDAHGNPIFSTVNENGVVVGPDGKPVAGIIGFDSEGHPIYSTENENGVVVGPDGKPVSDITCFDANGHPIFSKENENGIVVGPDGKPVAGVIGHDAQGHPIYAKINENGVVIGQDGKPVAGIVGYDAQGNPIYSRINEDGVVVGPDGKPVAGIIGFDSEGHPIYSTENEDGVIVGPDGKPVASHRKQINGAKVNENEVVIGSDGQPVQEIVDYDAQVSPIYSRVNENGIVVGPDGKPVASHGKPKVGAKVNENGVVIGPDGQPVPGIVGYDAQGNPIYSQVNENGVVVGPDGKPVAGIIGFDSEGHPIYSTVNKDGVIVGPDGKQVTEIVTGYDEQGNPIYSRVNKDGIVVGSGGKPVAEIKGHSIHPSVNNAAVPHGKPMAGAKINEHGVVIGPDGQPVPGIVGYDAQGNPIYSRVNENGIFVGQDERPIAGIIGFDEEGHPIYSTVNKDGVIVGPDGKQVTEIVTGYDEQGNPIYSRVNKDGIVVGPNGKPAAEIIGYDAQGHPIYPKINDKGVVIGKDGEPAPGIVGYDAQGNPIFSTINKDGVVVGPDGKPVAGIIGFDLEGHPIYSTVNKEGVIVGPDGKPVIETITGFDANGHPIFSKVNKNGVVAGQDGKPVPGIVGYDEQREPIFSIVNENGEVVSPDGKPVAGLIGFDSEGHPIYSTENEDGVIVGPDGKQVKETITGFDANGHPIYSKVDEKGDIVGSVSERNVALEQDGNEMKVLTLEDKYLTRKMSIRHVKLCKKGEKNAYNAALPWYISISGKRRHDEILRSQQFNCEDICLTRRMPLPHFRFIKEQPKPVEKDKSDDEAKERAIENIEENSEDELLEEEAKNAITQTPEDKVLTRKMSIRHIKLLKQGEKNYFEKNLKWYVSVSGKKRGSPEETKNVTRDFKIDPEDVVLTKHMSIPHLRTQHPVPKPKKEPKIDPEVEARNKANAEYDAKQAEKAVKLSPEDKVLTRKMSIRHIKLCKDGERNYFDNNLPWYISISGKKRGSPEETKNVTRDFEFDPEDVVLTRKMDIPHYNDPKCTEEYKQEQKKLRDEIIEKQREEELAAEEEEKRYEEENSHKGIKLTPEDKVLTRKMSIRHIKLCKNDEQNYYNRKLPWYVSISGKRRGSADECKADIRDKKFGPEDIVLTRHLSLPHFVPIRSDEPIEEFEEEDSLEVKSRDVNNENEEEETPEQKSKEFNLEDKVLTRKLSIRHIKVLKPGEKNYKRPCLHWYISTSGKWRGSHNEQKAVTRNVEFDQEDKILTRKLNLPHYVRPKCDEKGSNNNYTTCHMFDIKKKWW